MLIAECPQQILNHYGEPLRKWTPDTGKQVDQIVRGITTNVASGIDSYKDQLSGRLQEALKSEKTLRIVVCVDGMSGAGKSTIMRATKGVINAQRSQYPRIRQRTVEVDRLFGEKEKRDELLLNSSSSYRRHFYDRNLRRETLSKIVDPSLTGTRISPVHRYSGEGRAFDIRMPAENELGIFVCEGMGINDYIDRAEAPEQVVVIKVYILRDPALAVGQGHRRDMLGGKYKTWNERSRKGEKRLVEAGIQVPWHMVQGNLGNADIVYFDPAHGAGVVADNKKEVNGESPIDLAGIRRTVQKGLKLVRPWEHNSVHMEMIEMIAERTIDIALQEE